MPVVVVVVAAVPVVAPEAAADAAVEEDLPHATKVPRRKSSKRARWNTNVKMNSSVVGKSPTRYLISMPVCIWKTNARLVKSMRF